MMQPDRYLVGTMPRGPRLDAPGVLHHVVARGIERGKIFRDDRDRMEFLARLGALALETETALYAWCLIPNHFHLLVRSGAAPLSTLMRRLLTAYAVRFNHRHRRSGHLFQNRFKSIVVEDEPYFLELVRYLHLNPVRARLVPDVDALETYPWTGHATLLGRTHQLGQNTDVVLVQFGRTRATARQAYVRFVTDGVAQGRRPDLLGGATAVVRK
jgi:REP element-mobilizing transposase RayT